MRHEMRLDSAPFAAIASGHKTIEMRLFDEKRQKIAVGDEILFRERTEGRTLLVTVVALHRFPTFRELYATLPLTACGYLPEEVATASPDDMERYYPLSEQEEYGVVGIEVRRFRIFISHHTGSSQETVAKLSEQLSCLGYLPWSAEACIQSSHNYADAIPAAIRDSGLFVLLLNRYANESLHVQREVNIAMEAATPTLILRLEDCKLSNSIAYAASVLQMVDLRNLSEPLLSRRSVEEILSYLGQPMIDGEAVSNYKSEWDTNDLAFFGDEGERHRIALQRDFVHRFAADSYRDILSSGSGRTFLDVGCNTGEQAMMFLREHPEIRYVGIDREEAALAHGRSLFPDARFFLADLSADDLDERLTEIEEECGIDGFDYINLSLVLLHMKEPEELLDVLSLHLTEDGTLILLDIDDGYNVAEPDPDDAFKRAIKLCFETEYSGYRHCGRTAYRLLLSVDLDDICLHRLGLSTVGMSRADRDAFFEIYFWFVLDDLRKMHAELPQNRFIAADLAFMEEHYKEMKKTFKRKDFFFTLGFVLFTARRQGK